MARAERWAMAKKTLGRCRCGPPSPAAAQDGSVLETALRFFTRHPAAGIVERLDTVRPAPVSPAEKEEFSRRCRRKVRSATSTRVSGSAHRFAGRLVEWLGLGVAESSDQALTVPLRHP